MQDSTNAYCAVCKITRRNTVLMKPASTRCPVGWTGEYRGYLMAQKYYMKRTEYICVDGQPDTMRERWSSNGQLGGVLNFVETVCSILPCGSKDEYIDNAELACVVCSI